MDLDALQSQIEAQDAWNWEQRVEETLQRLHLDAQAIVGDLSGGTRKRVALENKPSDVIDVDAKEKTAEEEPWM